MEVNNTMNKKLIFPVFFSFISIAQNLIFPAQENKSLFLPFRNLEFKEKFDSNVAGYLGAVSVLGLPIWRLFNPSDSDDSENIDTGNNEISVSINRDQREYNRLILKLYLKAIMQRISAIQQIEKVQHNNFKRVYKTFCKLVKQLVS